MIEKINTWIIEKYIASSKVKSEFDKERIKYGFRVFLNETEKIIGIFLIFAICGLTKEFIISFLALMSLRIFIGGYHFSKNIYCFVFTLLFFLVAIKLSKYVIIERYIGILVFIIALLAVLFFAPLKAKHRAILKTDKKKKLKIMAMVIIIIMSIIYIFFSTGIGNLIIWTVALQQVEILYCILLTKKKERWKV